MLPIHKEIFIKVSSFCAYQERTHAEVKEKLYEFKISRDDVDMLVSKLIEENFLNEERFAKAYAGGKFRIKKWGRLKILQALREKKLSPYCIEQGLKEITPALYEQNLDEIIEKKLEKATKDAQKKGFKNIEQKQWFIRNTLARLVIAKGYESDLVWDKIQQLV